MSELGLKSVVIDDEFILWNECAIQGCKNGVCYRLNSDMCYPHTIEKFPHLKDKD
jgi:hypothetical protein